MRSLGLCVVLLACATQVHAQILRGQVIDAQSGQPVRSAEIVLMRDGPALARAVSDSLGRFQLGAPAGRYRVRASSIGYTTATSESLSLGPREVVDVTLRLSVRAVELRALEVTARQRANPGLEEFERRRKNSSGHFITGEEIQKFAPVYASSAVSRAPGVVLRDAAVGSRLIWMKMEHNLMECVANIYVDGVLLTSGSVDDILTPERIAAVEVYNKPADVPVEFMRPSAGCGVVAFWTRAAREDGKSDWRKNFLFALFIVGIFVVSK